MPRAVSAFTALGLAAVVACAYGASNQRGKPAATVPAQQAGGAVLFSMEDWVAPAKGKLPDGVFLAAGAAHVVTEQGRHFLQVTDSGSFDLQLKGDLPAAYSIEIEMQVPASTGYSVEVRPESEVTPPGTAGVTRRTAHPVVLCGAISSGVYGASATDTLKRYPNSEATQLRTCRIEADASSVRVWFANDLAADAVGASLGSGSLLRLHVPASASQPALIGKIKVAAAAGTTVSSTKKTVAVTSAPTYIEFNAPGGVLHGQLATAEGGDPVADPVEQLGATGVDLRPGPVRYTDIVASARVTQLGAFLSQWVAGQVGALDGRMIGYSFGKPEYQKVFTQARLTELGIPGLDGAAKDVGYLRLHLVPAGMRVEAVPPGTPTAKALGAKVKRWQVNQFRVDIPGLPTSRVRAVAPFTLTMKPGRNYLGGTRLSITFASVDVMPWAEWADEFLVQGTGAPERTVELKLLEPDMKDVLLTLKGSGVGILSLAPVTQEPNSEKMPLHRAELYVERWQLVPVKGVDE